MKYMILLYDNADMREIFSSRSDLMEEMDRVLEEVRQSGELVASEPLANPVQTKTVRPVEGLPVVTDGPLADGAAPSSHDPLRSSDGHLAPGHSPASCAR